MEELRTGGQKVKISNLILTAVAEEMFRTTKIHLFSELDRGLKMLIISKPYNRGFCQSDNCNLEPFQQAVIFSTSFKSQVLPCFCNSYILRCSLTKKHPNTHFTGRATFPIKNTKNTERAT